jgi:ACS family hexuronate transporter-like MFS transporter
MEPAPAPTTPGGRLRWVICGLLFLATAVNYMDRQVLGLLAPELEKQFGWNDRTYAFIVNGFQIAYMIGLVAVGPMLIRLGTKLGYGLSVGVWSVAIAAHALATSWVGFLVARFGLGLGEAGNFPAAIRATAQWFPRRERALATGIFNSGANIGSALAPLVVLGLAGWGGWKAPFVVLGVAGFAWLVLWWLLYSDPDRSRRLGAAERAWIAQDPPLAREDGGHLGWLELLRLRPTWAILIGFACSAPIWWFWLFWLPKFLSANYHLGKAEILWDSTLVYALSCIGSIAGGWLSSSLIGRGWSVPRARLTALLTCGLCVLPVMLVPWMGNHWHASLLIGLAAAAHQGWSANVFSLASDHIPKHSVAMVTSLGVFAGGLASVIAQQVVGEVLTKGIGFGPILLVAGCTYLVGWLALRPLLSGPRSST